MPLAVVAVVDVVVVIEVVALVGAVALSEVAVAHLKVVTGLVQIPLVVMLTLPEEIPVTSAVHQDQKIPDREEIAVEVVMGVIEDSEVVEGVVTEAATEERWEAGMTTEVTSATDHINLKFISSALHVGLVLLRIKLKIT